MIRDRKLVVAAFITNARGELLISQRRLDQPHPRAWELPGGKIEPGESPEAALIREIGEELGVLVAVGPVWDVVFHAYPGHDVYMLIYRCRIKGDDEPRCIEVKDLAWVERSHIGDYEILPADAPLLERWAKEG